MQAAGPGWVAVVGVSADPTLGECVGPWGLRRRTQDPDSLGGEDGVECGCVLAVAVSDQEPELADSPTEVDDQVAGLLGDPLTGGMRCGAEDVQPPGGDLDQEQHVDAGQPDGLDVQEVAGQDAFGLGGEELSPGGAARRGAGSTPAACRIVHTVLAAIR